MAYLPFNSYQDEEQNGQPVLSGESGLVQAGANPQSTAQNSAPGSGKGTGFVDLRRYIEQNQQKTGDLANKVGSSVENKANESQSLINTQKSVFDTEAQNKNKMDEGWVKTALKDPTKTVNNQDEFNRFTNLRTGTFQGPKSLSETTGWNDLQSSILAAKNYGELTKTPEGLETIMSSYSVDPTKGKSLLNNALLQQSPESISRLEQARTRTGDLDAYLKNANLETQESAKNIQSQLSAFAPKVSKWGDQSVSSLDAAIQKAYEANKAQGVYDVNQAIRNENEEIYNRQIAPGASNWTKKHGHAFVPDVSDVTFSKSQSATPEDFAREAALEKLMGKEYAALKNSEAGQAGTWKKAVDLMKTDPSLYDQVVLYNIPEGWKGNPPDYSPGSHYFPGNEFRQTPDGKLQYNERGKWVTLGDMKEETSQPLGSPYTYNTGGWGVRNSSDIYGTDTYVHRNKNSDGKSY